MYPLTSFQKNLHLPETGFNFSLNIFLKNSHLINFFEPLDFNNSCNQPLLKQIDSCDETRGKISFIPLHFLEIYIQKHQLIPDPPLFKNLLEKKQYYIHILEKNKIFNDDFFKKESYKDIPLKYFRKPYLASELTKTKDHCLLIDTADYILKDYPTLNLNFFNPENLVRNENEWLSKNDLFDIIQPFILSLPLQTQELVEFIPLIYLKTTHYNKALSYSELLHTYNWINKETTRFIITIILYRSHFTAVIIDKSIQTKNQHMTKFAFFFNSCGYIPNQFEYNPNYWFIDNTFQIINHKKLFTSYNNNYNQNVPIEALTNLLKNKYNITNFVFNTFSLQNFDSECGMFSTAFLYNFLQLISTKTNIGLFEYKFLYFNSLTIGSDLTYSLFRGLFYITHEDLNKNNITKSFYLNSPYIYNITNKKFQEYLQLYYKSLSFIENLSQKTILEKNKILTYYPNLYHDIQSPKTLNK